MSRNPSRGGRGNNPRGRGRGNTPRITQSDIEAYLKAKAAQFPALNEIVYGEGSSSAAEILQKEVEYLTSPITDPIMVIEFNDEKWQNEPWEIKSRYLDTMEIKSCYTKLLVSFSFLHLLRKQFKSQEKKPINPFLEISKKIHQENPSLSEDDVVIKTMDFMKNQLFETFKPPGDDESMTSAKSAEDDNPFTCLAGESQDPYEDEDPNGATLADYWDGITQLLTEQMKKGKGHQ